MEKYDCFGAILISYIHLLPSTYLPTYIHTI